MHLGGGCVTWGMRSLAILLELVAATVTLDRRYYRMLLANVAQGRRAGRWWMDVAGVRTRGGVYASVSLLRPRLRGNYVVSGSSVGLYSYNRRLVAAEVLGEGISIQP